MEKDVTIIGIDGGATKVSAWNVIYDEVTSGFALGEINVQKSYREIPGFIPDFKPVELSVQLKENEQNDIRPTKDEEQQAAVYVEACAQVVEEMVKRTGQSRILIGIGMPGIKTADKRGIAVVANGPRMLNYAEHLEGRLSIKRIELARPIAHIGSDADYCGIGENYAAEGAFRPINNGYYLGGGTGVADALKLDGKLLPFDQTKSWLAKSWEMKTESGISLEKFASAGGIQSLYAQQAGQSVEQLNQDGIYPLQIARMAADGDANARQTFKMVADSLSMLLFERITTLFAGWQGFFSFVNPNRAPLSDQHPYLGKLFDRLVIGQRLGELFDSPAGQEVLRAPVLEKLKHSIETSAILSDDAKAHYANLDKIVITSRLREAPALGAGIDAVLAAGWLNETV